MLDHFDATRWAQLTVFEQMGNIGSEVGRTMAAMRRGDSVSGEAAVRRALDLFDATVASWSDEGRLRELLRARELFLVSVENKEPDQKLDDYFFNFALVARAGR